MFDTLGDAIEALDAPAEGTSIVALLALRDRLDARVAEVLGAFDAESGWALDGATSLTAWLRHHAGASGPAACRAARTARPPPVAAGHGGRLPGGWPERRAGRGHRGQRHRAHGRALRHHEADLLPALAPVALMSSGLRSPEAARRLGLDGADVYRLLFDGELDGGPGNRRHVYFSEA